VLRLFGTNATREARGAGPTRLLVRDAMAAADWRRGGPDAGRELTEARTEVVIDRIAGKALDGVGPRRTERVHPRARGSTPRRPSASLRSGATATAAISTALPGSSRGSA